jgi:desulfoferrodoxin-like iron-binding protein
VLAVESRHCAGYNEARYTPSQHAGVAGQVANETGKRYVCALCGAEFIVTRGGNGTLTCCNQPMQLKR